LKVRPGPHGFVVFIGAPEGSYNPAPRRFNFVVKLLGQTPKIVSIVDDHKPRQIEIR
jgi:hypothetical protein